jgi:hypothetical protein
MPGFLVEEGAVVMCAHGGQAQQVVPNESVTLDGMASSLLPDPWIVAGCPGIPAAAVPPCVPAQWLVGTTRVTSFGQPLLVQSSTATSTTNGTPLLPVVVTQTRVVAI